MILARAIDWALVVAAVVALARAVMRGREAAAHPFLWFFVGSAIFLNLGSIRDSVWGPTHDPSQELRFHLLEIAHLALVWIGFRLARAHLLRRRVSSAPTGFLAAGLKVRRFWLLLGLTAMLKMYASNPLVPFQEAVSNFVRVLALLAVSAGCLAIAIYEEARARMSSYRQVAWGLVMVAIVLIWTFEQSRTPVVYGVFCLLNYALWRLQGSRRIVLVRPMVALYAIPLAAVLVLAMGSAVKGFAIMISDDADAEKAVTVAKQHGTSLEFIDAYANGLYAFENYPEPSKFRYGESIGSVALGLVPRSWWPGKPTGFAHHLSVQRLGQQLVDAGNSLSTSLLGDLWAGGGLINVILLSLAWGWAMAWAHRWQELQPSMSRRVVYWQFLVLATILQRGDIYTIVVRGAEIIVFSLLLIWVATGSSKRSQIVRRAPTSCHLSP